MDLRIDSCLFVSVTTRERVSKSGPGVPVTRGDWTGDCCFDALQMTRNHFPSVLIFGDLTPESAAGKNEYSRSLVAFGTATRSSESPR